MILIARLAMAGLCALAISPALADDSTTAWVENHSAPNACRDFDNVYVALSNPKVGSFEIEATAPYALPDANPAHPQTPPGKCDAPDAGLDNGFAPKQSTLFEDASTRITGETFAKSWKAHGAEIALRDKETSDVHLVHYAWKIGDRFVDFLTIDPVGGVWRVGPPPSDGRVEAALGSSFLIGPVEQEHGPSVDVSRLEIDPEARTFRLRFAKGGEAVVRIRSADEKRVVLDVAVGGLPRTEPPLPFAALRSMFVSPTEANVDRVNWRTDKGLFNETIMKFKSANVGEVRFDRLENAHFNPAAPDLTFRAFSSPPAKKEH